MQTDVSDTTQNAWDGNGFVFIKGVTSSGKNFRPSDWCDRLHNTLQALSPPDRTQCAEYVHLVNVEGRKGVLVDCMLKNVNGQLFVFFANFAANNDLSTMQISREDWQNLSK